MEPSGWGFGGVKVLLVNFVHTVVYDKLNELFEELNVGSNGFKRVALLLRGAVVGSWLNVSSMVFVKY